MSRVAAFDSHGRAPCLLGRTTYPWRGVCCFLSEPPKPAPKTTAGRPHVQAGGSGPVSLQRPATSLQAVFSSALRAYSGPSLLAPKPQFRDRQFLRPQPRPAGGLVTSGALFGSEPAGPKHTRAEQVKARRLRYARQELVRVPESNTKYGGKGGKTGSVTPP